MVTLGLVLPFLSDKSLLASLKLSPSPPSAHLPTRPLSAGNATLGFQTIQVINLPRRHDRADMLVLQSSISNLSLHITPGVDISDISDNQGMPPNSSPGSLKESEKACFRAHANVRPLPSTLLLDATSRSRISLTILQLWRRMLDEKWSSVLIMEADAAWDVDVRTITQRLSYALNDLMDAYPRTSLTVHPSEHDPYNVAKWDLISLGQCHESTKHSEESLIYSDENAPLNMSYYGRPLVDERVVRRSGGIVCTTAYALSPRGALKLLVKTSVDFNIPIDLAIRSMIESDELIAYSVQPSIIAQWIYRAGSGSESANSDVSNPAITEPVDHTEVWHDIHDSMNVWALKPYHEDARFRNGALQALGRIAFGDRESRGQDAGTV